MITRKKSNTFKNLVRLIYFVSFSGLLLRLGFLGKIHPELIAFFFVFLIVVLAIGRKVVYAILGVVSFVLFIKLYTNNSQEECAVITTIMTIALVFLVIYKMVKGFFRK